MNRTKIPKSDRIKPCPLCGSNELSLVYHSISGHGDSGYSGLRVMCDTCTCSKGDGYGYSDPEEQRIVETINNWNTR